MNSVDTSTLHVNSNRRKNWSPLLFPLFNYLFFLDMWVVWWLCMGCLRSSGGSFVWVVCLVFRSWGRNICIGRWLLDVARKLGSLVFCVWLFVRYYRKEQVKTCSIGSKDGLQQNNQWEVGGQQVLAMETSYGGARGRKRDETSSHLGTS